MRTAGEFRFLNVLTALNVTFLLISDFTGARLIAVQGIAVSVTILYFPLTYLIGDLVTEVYGYSAARRVIWISVGCSLLGSVLAAGELVAPAPAFFSAEAAYRAVFSVSPRIAVAGLFAFFAGDICNSYVLAKMKVWDQGRRLWARFIASTVVGEGVNTLLFYGLALSGVLPRRQLWLSILTGWGAKVAVEVVMLPVSYAVVRSLKRAERTDYYDVNTDFNPLRIR